MRPRDFRGRGAKASTALVVFLAAATVALAAAPAGASLKSEKGVASLGESSAEVILRKDLLAAGATTALRENTCSICYKYAIIFRF